jgi:hypothetical protein
MNNRHLSLPLPGLEPAVLMLPPTMSPDTLLQLETALTATLGALRREVRSDTTDAGQIEYASWSQTSPAKRH